MKNLFVFFVGLVRCSFRFFYDQIESITQRCCCPSPAQTTKWIMRKSQRYEHSHNFSAAAVLLAIKSAVPGPDIKKEMCKNPKTSLWLKLTEAGRESSCKTCGCEFFLEQLKSFTFITDSPGFFSAAINIDKRRKRDEFFRRQTEISLFFLSSPSLS